MLRFRSYASLFCALGTAVAGVTIDTGEARACGGCFHEPPQSIEVVDTVVTDHRMAFSLSPAQTVLWDQITYTGNPSEFAWVLPVRPGATIQLSQDAWLAALEASTQTVIIGPTSSCGAAPTEYENGGGGGCGSSFGSASFGSAAEDEADAGAVGTPQVQVLMQEVVGPYESVTVRASQGEALGAWLNANGFDVPAALQPTIDSFTMAGFDFIALKLRPGEGVQAMQPVRIVTPGADPTLPLRMVAAGVGSDVTLELFVLSEGRYHTQNFPDATIDFSKLAWDPTLQDSTYSTLMQQALAANGGTGWLTEFAGLANLGNFSSGPNPGLLAAYTSQCVPAPATCTTEASPAAVEAEGGDEAATGAGADAAAGDDAGDGAGGGEGDSGGDAVATDASTDANAEASVASDAGDAAPPATVTVCTAAVTCDDLQVAMTGIDPGNLWITRLRADLPASALAADLVLEATSSQVPVANVHTTETYTIPGYNPCASTPASASPSSSTGSDGSCACRTAESSRRPPSDTVAFAMAAVGIAFAASRRRRR
ncbi:MAG: DUF2330 domain-containing protein [Polyangiaceae bacterium]|jgi:MYXO-CTERM domain-containing protein